MRKVLFKRWIPGIRVDVNGNTKIGGSYIKKDTQCWDIDFIHEGVFHQWANAYEEFETGAGNYTIALVELENGEIESVLPMNIKFIN